MRLSEGTKLQARRLIADRLGLDFPEARSSDLEHGLAGALRDASSSAPEALLAWLAELPDEAPELRRLAARLTVGETYFFRDQPTMEALERHVLPSLIATRRAQGSLRLRLWSAACATGEEPYTLAILLDRLLPDRADWSLTVLATDINSEALDAAQAGRYREWSFRETPAGIRERYFVRRADGTYELDPEVRRIVSFAPLNLAGDAYPSLLTNTSAMDLILCRNVLMYFTRDAQRAAVERLRRCLVGDGWLVVAAAEASAELLHPLAPVNFPGAIVHRGQAALPAESPTPAPATPAAPSEPLWQRFSPSPPGGGGRGERTAFRPAPAPIQAAGPSAPAGSPFADSEATSGLGRARALADEGRLDEAGRLCGQAILRDRLDADAYLLLAAIRQEQGDNPAAREALRRALYLAPESAAAHFLMGGLSLREGDKERGRRCMQNVVALLGGAPCEQPVAGGGGLTAGRLIEIARTHLESA